MVGALFNKIYAIGIGVFFIFIGLWCSIGYKKVAQQALAIQYKILAYFPYSGIIKKILDRVGTTSYEIGFLTGGVFFLIIGIWILIRSILKLL